MGEIKLSDITRNISITNDVSLIAVERNFELRQAHLELQGSLAKPFAWAFIVINALVIFGIAWIWSEEWWLIRAGADIDRLITPEVIMSIIGGTTIQLGAIMLTLTRKLFGSPDQPILSG